MTKVTMIVQIIFCREYGQDRVRVLDHLNGRPE